MNLLPVPAARPGDDPFDATGVSLPEPVQGGDRAVLVGLHDEADLKVRVVLQEDGFEVGFEPLLGPAARHEQRDRRGLRPGNTTRASVHLAGAAHGAAGAHEGVQGREDAQDPERHDDGGDPYHGPAI